MMFVRLLVKDREGKSVVEMKAGADLSPVSLETKIFLDVLSVLCPRGWTAPAAT